MKKAIFLFLIITTTCFSQEEIFDAKRLKCVAVEFSFSPFNRINSFLDYQDFQAISNKSLPEITSLGNQSSQRYNGSIGEYFQLNLNFNVNGKNGKKLRGNPLLRMGFSYIPNMNNTLDFQTTNTFAFDTIYTTFQGVTSKQAVDSIAENYTSFSVLSDRLRFSSSILWQTDPSKRWCFFGGIGAGVGFSLNSVFQIKNSHYNYFVRTSTENDFHPLEFNLPRYQSEQITTQKANGWFDATLFTPIGIDFRWGKKENFWYHVHQFIEYSPTVWIQHTKQINTQFAFANTLQLGCRTTLENLKKHTLKY
jgi:hypothetical protein